MTHDGRAHYVVSAYLSPPGLKAFTTHRHDQSVALWRVGADTITLVRYWEVERVSGLKHHELPLYDEGRSPEDLVGRLLAREGLSRQEVARFWGTPGLGGAEVFPTVDRCGLPMHSLAHLFSGLCMDGQCFRDATIVALAMDGGPDYTLEHDVLGDRWYAGAVSRHGRVAIRPVESPGLLWQAAQRLFGKEPGTLMALAHASPASVDYDLGELLAHRYWGGYPLMGQCYAFVRRIADVATSVIRSGHDSGEGSFTRDDLVASAVMKIVQAASIHIVRRNLDALLAEHGVAPDQAYLSLSGGYALNCPTNSRLLSAYGFRGLLAPPCANDSGQALGLGLLGFYATGELDTHHVECRLPYAGEERLDAAPAFVRWRPHILDVTGFDEETFVKDLQQQPVAWVDGAAEVGPRALGHRSLLGDPRRMQTKRFLNAVKQRQWWRPVAPIVLEDFVGEWFVGGRPSPYMLETFPVAPEYQPFVPAVMHLDGSARIQTLSAALEPFLTCAVRAFHHATGVPIVCNTSLNDKGEPIANDASDALNFCLRKGIAVAYVGRQRVLLDVSGQAPVPDGPQRRPLADYYSGQHTRPDIVFGDGPDPEIMFLLYIWPSLFRFVGTPGGDVRLRSIVRLVRQRDEGFAARADEFMAYWRDLLLGKISHGGLDAR